MFIVTDTWPSILAILLAVLDWGWLDYKDICFVYMCNNPQVWKETLHCHVSIDCVGKPVGSVVYVTISLKFLVDVAC